MDDGLWLRVKVKVKGYGSRVLKDFKDPKDFRAPREPLAP